MRDRVDKYGRAYAESQRQLQTYVNETTGELTKQTVDVLGLCQSTNLTWVSPLAAQHYAEYRDEEFLHVVGLRPNLC